MEVLWLGRGRPKPTKEELAHLRIFYPILSTRREFLLDKRPWHELHWAREESLFTGPKLVNSYRTYDNSFAFNDTPFFGGADLTFISSFEEAKVDLFFLLGLLNSDLIYSWFYFRGKRKGEMLELKQVPVSEVPIARDEYLERMIAQEAKRVYQGLKVDPKFSIVDHLDSINSLVYQLYNLSILEVQVIKQFALSKSEIRNNHFLDVEPNQD